MEGPLGRARVLRRPPAAQASVIEPYASSGVVLSFLKVRYRRWDSNPQAREDSGF